MYTRVTKRHLLETKHMRCACEGSSTGEHVRKLQTSYSLSL
nr:MAG TPA: hypothetical protein [Caudoviricetes sp.]